MSKSVEERGLELGTLAYRILSLTQSVPALFHEVSKLDCLVLLWDTRAHTSGVAAASCGGTDAATERLLHALLMAAENMLVTNPELLTSDVRARLQLILSGVH